MADQDSVPLRSNATSEQKTEPVKKPGFISAISNLISSFKKKSKTQPAKFTIASALLYMSGIFIPRSPSSKNQKKVGFCLPAAETHSPSVQGLPIQGAPEHVIECFCSTIQGITGIQTSVGVLVYNDSKHQVWVPRASLTSARVEPLAKLLSRPVPPMIERLKLAVRLASSVLQLHTSGWLQERWGKQDIYLIQRDSPESKNPPSLETPVVYQAFTSKPSPLKTSIESRIILCNASLFSLGIVLIELWFWRSMESFQTDKSQPEDPDMARYMAAVGLINQMRDDAGAKYSSSVQRCICGVDHPETQLENNEFKNEAYHKVLWPLQQDLENFCGKPIGKIFEKQSVHPALSVPPPPPQSSSPSFHLGIPPELGIGSSEGA